MYRKIKNLLLTGLFIFISSLSFAGENHWIGAWGGSTVNYSDFKNFSGIADYHNQTIRVVATSTFTGSSIRIKLSNEFGTEDMEIGSAKITLDSKNNKVNTLTFNGKKNITIKKGSFIWSDPAKLKIKAMDKVAVSFYIKNQIKTLTGVCASAETYLSEKGDFTTSINTSKDFKAVSYNGFTPITPFFVGMDILGDKNDSTIIAFGDSITTYSWPEYLARAFSEAGIKNVSVVREAISGNKVLNDGPPEIGGGFGIAGIKRFEKAITSHDNVKSVIVLEGINDILHSEPGLFTPSKIVSADDLIKGFQNYIEIAHKHNLKIYGATIMPYEGNALYTLKGEKVREDVNNWIRNNSNYDGIFDFDKAVRDSKNPKKLALEFDLGDSLHPSDAGGAALAKSIDLDQIK